MGVLVIRLIDDSEKIFVLDLIKDTKWLRLKSQSQNSSVFFIPYLLVYNGSREGTLLAQKRLSN